MGEYMVIAIYQLGVEFQMTIELEHGYGPHNGTEFLSEVLNACNVIANQIGQPESEVAIALALKSALDLKVVDYAKFWPGIFEEELPWPVPGNVKEHRSNCAKCGKVKVFIW